MANPAVATEKLAEKTTEKDLDLWLKRQADGAEGHRQADGAEGHRHGAERVLHGLSVRSRGLRVGLKQGLRAEQA